MRPTLRFALLLCIALPFQATQAALDPDLPPGGNFDLDNWNITVPAAAPDGPADRPLTVYPPDLSGPFGYSSPWFYSSDDGAMTFWAPVDGLAGGGSPKPRSELREMIDPGNPRVNWDSHGTSILEAQVRVAQVPSDGVVIIGQVHGFDSPPLVLLYYLYDFATQTGQVMVKLQGLPVHSQPFTHHTLASDIRLGQSFVYQIRVIDGIAAAQANNGPSAEMVIDPAWDRETFYFKAGAYLYSHQGNGGALVRFYRLAASHARNDLRIASKATLPSAHASQPYQTLLQAAGGTGGGTWTLVSGRPPAGLVLGPDGAISGTPVESGSHGFMARVRDADGNHIAKSFSIQVSP
ncbi:polysaccharide lyase family 7 protein [Zestomonas carbonaria]|nr:polysaccharide lyase family 7 protein [Pseudomonas carbonaria]